MPDSGDTATTETNPPVESGKPFFESRVLFTHRDVPEGFEDGFCINELSGCAAIADGVASGIYSKAWADVLTEQFVADRPDPSDQSAFSDWVMKCRKLWSKRIPPESQRPWNEELKLQQYGGGFATFLSIAAERHGDQYRVEVFAVGDCNLLHLRRNQLKLSFPMQAPEDFGIDPVSLASFGNQVPDGDGCHRVTILAEQGDILVLATDAIAANLLHRVLTNNAPNWGEYFEIPESDWLTDVAAARESREMRFDDITLVVARFLASTEVTCSEDPTEAEPISSPDGCVFEELSADPPDGKDTVDEVHSRDVNFDPENLDDQNEDHLECDDVLPRNPLP